MNSRKKGLWLLPIVVLICLFTLPAEVGSQCSVSATLMLPGSPVIIVKFLSASAYCIATASNADSCFPSTMTGSTVYSLSAVAYPATMSPYCNWSCACGTGAPPHVTIDGPGDGLPVELMDFTIE